MPYSLDGEFFVFPEFFNIFSPKSSLVGKRNILTWLNHNGELSGRAGVLFRAQRGKEL
jgi:hypothetical protein